jgi:hypothetical protein
MTAADTIRDPASVGVAAGLRLSPFLLVGGDFVLTTVAQTLFHLGFSIWDSRENFGAGDLPPEEQIPVIVALGVFGLLVALGVAKWLSGDRARRGAVALGVLSILTLPLFFSGAPASFGTMAAVRAGLARGGSPVRGAARSFGVVGIVVTVLIIIAVWGGNAAGIIEHTTT